MKGATKGAEERRLVFAMLEAGAKLAFGCELRARPDMGLWSLVIEPGC